MTPRDLEDWACSIFFFSIFFSFAMAALFDGLKPYITLWQQNRALAHKERMELERLRVEVQAQKDIDEET